jgi:hypothetical protein
MIWRMGGNPRPYHVIFHVNFILTFFLYLHCRSWRSNNFTAVVVDIAVDRLRFCYCRVLFDCFCVGSHLRPAPLVFPACIACTCQNGRMESRKYEVNLANVTTRLCVPRVNNFHVSFDSMSDKIFIYHDTSVERKSCSRFYSQFSVLYIKYAVIVIFKGTKHLLQIIITLLLT